MAAAETVKATAKASATVMERTSAAPAASVIMLVFLVALDQVLTPAL